ncbi:MAG: hypothetical protein RBS43_07380 [Candidatus Cloacimonas sp.]|jgi:lipoate-protein ligase A|nr:hypothetical protein [Candidatus Cloacimonas sp.]
MNIAYPLPDKQLIDSCFQNAAAHNFAMQGEFHFSIFVPKARYVSIGASNTPASSAHLDNCIADGVQVFKRLSGGEAVYLSPNCVICTSIIMAERLPASRDFFTQNLQWISSSLSTLGISNISRKGISDLSIGDKKILGCAIYRRTQVMIFQAVLNVCEAPSTIQRYLLHPAREPDYRASRTHNDFISSLSLEGYLITPQEITDYFSQRVVSGELMFHSFESSC